MIHGYTISLYSTNKCDGVTTYHLSVGISARVYTFSLVPTDKWYMVTPSPSTSVEFLLLHRSKIKQLACSFWKSGPNGL